MTHDGGMVRDLLDNQDSLATTILVWPNTVEQFTKDGIKWLIGGSALVVHNLHMSAPSPHLLLGSHLLISGLNSQSQLHRTAVSRLD